MQLADETGDSTLGFFNAISKGGDRLEAIRPLFGQFIIGRMLFAGKGS